MPDLPDIPHAIVETSAEGFSATPVGDSPHEREAFDRSVKTFMHRSRDWRMHKDHRDDDSQLLDLVLFVPADSA